MKDVETKAEQLAQELRNAQRRLGEMEALQESQRLIENQLRQSERRYRLFAENIADIIWVVHARSSNQLVYISPSVARLLGYGVDELMAKKMNDVLTQESVRIVNKALADEFSKEKKQPDLSALSKVELQAFHRDGNVITITALYSFLPGSEGRPSEILVVVQNGAVKDKTEEGMKSESQHLQHAG